MIHGQSLGGGLASAIYILKFFRRVSRLSPLYFVWLTSRSDDPQATNKVDHTAVVVDDGRDLTPSEHRQ
jgi:hypothetical protein